MDAHPAEPAGSSFAQGCDVALMTQESPVTHAPQQPETDPPGDRFYRHNGVLYKRMTAPIDSGCTTFACSSLDGFENPQPTQRRMRIAC